MSEQIELVRRVVRQFAQEFVENPYLCYTEHGFHALLFTRLYNALPDGQRYAAWQGQRVCLIQKEYPTATALDKSKRQNWDIALLDVPLDPIPGCDALPYDCFKLAAAIELGLNEGKEHLVEDVRRLARADAKVGQGFILHLYRLSEPDAEASSRRDARLNWDCVLPPEKVADLAKDGAVEIVYGLYNGADPDTSGVWLFGKGEARYWPRHMGILEEYFEVQSRETWAYSFRPKDGAGWAARPTTRIARTSAQGRNLLLFTIGAQKDEQEKGLDRKIEKIIERHELNPEREKTTAGNRKREYIGFDLTKSCTPEKLRVLLEEVKLEVAECSRALGRPL